MSSKLLRGTFILTIGTFLSKFLGLIYVIPFYALVGEEGGALYNFAYVPYMIFLSVATAGVPLAVSKYVSKYNALGQYRVGRKLFDSGILLMIGTGIVSFLILYGVAPFLPGLMISKDTPDFQSTKEQITLVMRTVSFALLIVPVMSLIRGFFQGHESMGPTAVSQVVEQIVRILFILGSTFIVLKVAKGEMVTAIGLATFAAFIGALGGLAVLIRYFLKRKKHLNELVKQDTTGIDIPLKDMYKELLIYAAPFVFVGIANPMYQIIDQFTFIKTMEGMGLADIAKEAFAMITMYSHKLVLIPVSLATSFGLTLIPTVTKSFVEGNKKLLTKQLNQTFQIVFFLTFPAVIGLSILAYPAYASFYSLSDLGGEILRWYAPVAILFAFFSVTAAILQGINQQKFTVYSLLLGLVIKLVLNVWFITMFQSIGAILATALGYTASVVFNLYIIKKYTNFNFYFVFRRTLLMGIFTAIMSVIVLITIHILGIGISYEDGKLQAITVILISAIIGAGVYLYLSYKTNLIHILFGHRFSFLQKKKALREE